MDPQQPRTLRLAAPHMHGPDVAEVQRLLGVADDGEFGPVTAGVVADWKRARGVVPASRELDLLGRRMLLGDVLLRAVRLMEHWAIARVGEEPVGSNRVAELVALAERLDVLPEFARMGYPWCVPRRSRAFRLESGGRRSRRPRRAACPCACGAPRANCGRQLRRGWCGRPS